MPQKTLGILVNPVAGIGGSVGLKGSDGTEIQRLALQRGARKTAPDRATVALREIAEIIPEVRVLTCPGDMGENECRMAGLNPELIDVKASSHTTAEDTETAVRKFAELGIDLLMFAGGDGTARNVYAASKGRLNTIGIPAGVKIHSAVFARNPRCAGMLAVQFLKGKVSDLRELEVMDIDEDAFRDNRVSARLYGFLPVPFAEGMVQKQKEGSINERSALESIAAEICERMTDKHYYIIGAGTTTRCITDRLGLPKTLLGVDVIYQGKIFAQDVSEQEILSLLNGKEAKIIITPIGGQGFLFGRGNQQLSGQVIEKVGVENIIVVATLHKIADLQGIPFSIDLGNVEEIFPKYIRVVTGYHQELLYPIAV